jgi:hypothetical protein
MISEPLFEEKIEKLIHLCGFVFKEKAKKSFYDAIKYEKEEDILKGMSLMTEDPPAKLTLKSLKYFINQTKNDGEKTPDWDGSPCYRKNCEEGLVYEKLEGYSYAFRCKSCDSHRMKILPYHTEENVSLAKEQAKGKRI